MNVTSPNTELQTFTIDLHHSEFGCISRATLHFGGDDWPQVHLPIYEPLKVSDGARFDLLKAVADNGTVFSLCDCVARGYVIYADYVVETELESTEFDLFSVRYNGVSEWFLQSQKIAGTIGETLTWSQKPAPINVVVRTADDDFHLRSECVRSSYKERGNLVLHEHVEFLFSSSKSRFNLVDATAKANELGNMLSVLIGYPANIEEIAIATEPKQHYHRVYFPTIKLPSRDLKYDGWGPKFFIQQSRLEGRWQDIFDHFYMSPYRKVCWPRLSGMQRYEGFWEYKVLGYVSLLDRYLEIRYQNVKRLSPPLRPTKKLANFKNRLHQSLPHLPAGQHDQIVEIACSSFSSDYANLVSRYRQAVSESDKKVINIINLSESNFDLAKKARNSIAHGDKHGLADTQLTSVFQAQSKIALLLTYWAFIDFGLTTEDFIQCLNLTRNPLRFAAMLDEVELSRTTGRAEFFHVSEEEFSALKSTQSLRVFGCCIQDDTGRLNFSDDLTRIFAAWRAEARLGRMTAKDIFGVEGRCVDHAYFESAFDRFEVNHMWIVKSADLRQRDAQRQLGSE